MTQTRKGQLTITRAAKLLGVHRVHLSAVLNGRRTSASLTRRYRELKKSHAKEVASA
jgi:hypothetical protein